MNIYTVAENYDVILCDLFEKMEAGEIDEQTFLDTMESVEGDLKKRAINLAHFIKNSEAKAEAIKKEEKRLYEKRKKEEIRIEKIERLIFSAMDKIGLPKIEGDFFDISIKKNPASVNIYDETLLDEDFWKIRIDKTYDKTLIKERLKNGFTVLGAELKEGSRLEIK